MTMIDLDDELYKKISEFVENNKIDYPSIRTFVNIAAKNQLRIDKIKAAHQKINQ